MTVIVMWPTSAINRYRADSTLFRKTFWDKVDESMNRSVAGRWLAFFSLLAIFVIFYLYTDSGRGESLRAFLGTMLVALIFGVFFIGMFASQRRTMPPYWVRCSLPEFYSMFGEGMEDALLWSAVKRENDRSRLVHFEVEYLQVPNDDTDKGRTARYILWVYPNLALNRKTRHVALVVEDGLLVEPLALTA